MIALISTTSDPLYSFYMPITSWSWAKRGIKPYIYMFGFNKMMYEVYNWSKTAGGKVFEVPDERQVTYAQCSRLYGHLIEKAEENETIVVGDIDMAYFGDMIKDEPEINIYGSDLVPDGQFPMCYIAMSKENWRIVMGDETDLIEALDKLLGKEECNNKRGDWWCRDQETIFNRIKASGLSYKTHERRISDRQRTARNRADRDGWNYNINGLIDAHLPRHGGGYEDNNFKKILTLFQEIYPQENFDWMVEYRNRFVELLNEK
jgi:hypothetical protein